VQPTRKFCSDFLASYAEGTHAEPALSAEEQKAILDEMAENRISMTKGHDQSPVLNITPLGNFKAEKKFDIIRNTLNEMKFIEPTPIQKYAIPVALGKNDLIGIAKTGSGKTLGFMLPAIQSIKHFKHKFRKNSKNPYNNRNKPLGLVIGPTRELVF
jgi:superfamily II DNA/RNA helicase